VKGRLGVMFGLRYEEKIEGDIKATLVENRDEPCRLKGKKKTKLRSQRGVAASKSIKKRVQIGNATVGLKTKKKGGTQLRGKQRYFHRGD